MYTEVSNVWESQATSPEEALALQTRADLMINLREIIHQNGWNQKEAASQLGITQNRVSYISTGQVSKFTTDKLISLLSKVDYRVSLTGVGVPINLNWTLQPVSDFNGDGRADTLGGL